MGRGGLAAAIQHGYINEVQAWVQSVLDGEATGPSAWDGYVSILVADACIGSGRESRPVKVNLPERPSDLRVVAAGLFGLDRHLL